MKTRDTRVGWSVSGVSLVARASERVMFLTTRPISWLRKEIVSTFVEI